MNELYFHRLVSALGPNEDGLSDAEVREIEERYGFAFPPDLRSLLQYCVPVAGQFPKWRGDAGGLARRLKAPADGILFEVEHHGFWLDVWGERPPDALEAFKVAAGYLQSAPALIPVYGKRYLASQPVQAGNPVFTVEGASVSYAGFDLVSYYKAEFHVPFVEGTATEPRRVEFWSELLEPLR